MITKLSHVSLSSNSLVKVKNYYVKKLGLKIVHEFRNEKNQLYGYFLKTKNNSYLEFFKVKNKIHISSNNEKFRHICFEVSNIKKFNEKVFKNRFQIKRGKTDKILQFFTYDLEGNEIEFHQKDKISKF